MYEYMGRWLPMEVRTETITVKGGAPVTFQVKATRHGPIVSDFMTRPNGKQLRDPLGRSRDQGE